MRQPLHRPEAAPMRTRLRKIAGRVLLFTAALMATITFAPQVLAWPYSEAIGHTIVYSERPIRPEMRSVLARADALLARSPLAQPDLERRVFLTEGGWRWNALALTSRGAFALRRPFRDAILINRSDVAADRVRNGAAATRTLSSIIAHETTHILVARHLGELRALMLPRWKSEGYADHVSGESALSDADYARLRAAGEQRQSMFYYEARRRVAAALAANGNDVYRMLTED